MPWIRNSWSSSPSSSLFWRQDLYFRCTKFINSDGQYLVTVQLLGNFLEQHYFNPLKLRNGCTLLRFPLLSSDTWIQHLPFLQKQSAHTHCRMCPDFSTALVMSLSTGLSSTDFTISSPSLRCATSRVYHDVALSSTHIDGQCHAGKMFERCNLNHQTGKCASFTQFAFLLVF